MQLSISTDSFGRMVCSVSCGGSSAVATSAGLEEAAAALSAALDDVELRGAGECYWCEGTGEYRWVFRRAGEKVRVAILWSIGVMTGWEHVFWAECGCSEFLRACRKELARSASLAKA